MKIYLITPIYATTTSKQGATPVVHYFAREWVKMGHEVTVFQFEAKYPQLYYWAGKHFQHYLNTKLGILVPITSPKEEDYIADGVMVHKRCLRKFIPHSRYCKKQLQYALNIICRKCENESAPDWFVGHWDNPQLELLYSLKKLYGKPTCLVLHSNEFNFEIKYGKDGLKMLNSLDIIGFRSKISLRHYEEKYGKLDRSFVAYSGVPEVFLAAGLNKTGVIHYPVQNFVFVGSLIARKFPVAIISALSRVYLDGNFTMTFIGDGAEKVNIEQEHLRLGGLGKIRFTGRIPRENIIQYLKESDVFVMISSEEIFGLVYLEAMALGVIPVGSKNEGIDGVIKDGENGFLCKAGDINELTSVLMKIKQLKEDQLLQLSNKAQQTANAFSDECVARMYLDNLNNELHHENNWIY